MKRVLFFLVPLVGFLVLAGFLLRGLWLNPREVPSPLIGKPAPVFEKAKLASPNEVFSSKDMAGQVWILNVWASWCTPCRVEHPLMNELAAKNIVPIIGMNYKDTPEAGRKWLAELGDPYTTTFIDYDGRLGIDFGVYGVPETFLIDKNGIIRHKHIGPLTPEALRDTILPKVKELNAAS